MEVEVLQNRRVIVTALPLKRDARARLAELLDARVVDIREPVDNPDLVLTPACSPQLIGALSRKYNGARIVVVELDDWDYDIALHGPVKRMLRNGAVAYLLADSIDELAQKLAVRDETQEAVPVHELTAAATVDDLIAAFLRESVEYAVNVHATER